MGDRLGGPVGPSLGAGVARRVTARSCNRSLRRLRRRAQRAVLRHLPQRKILLLGTLGAVGVLGAWLALTGLMARQELTQAHAAAKLLHGQLLAREVAAADATAGDLASHASRAKRLSGGPVWSLAAAVPLVGEPFRSVRAIAAAAHEVGDAALPALVDASRRLDPAEVRGRDGSIALELVAALAPALQTSATALERALAAVEGSAPRSWLPPVDSARSQLLDELAPLAGTARAAAAASALLPEILGRDGTRTYLLVFQNNAEARGTGGLPGAFGIMRARDGKISFGEFDSDRVLQDARARVSFGADYERLYGNAGTTTRYGNANLSPHFPYAAEIWAAMWKDHSGIVVDGVIALDPAVLSYILAAADRPLRLADGTSVTAGNVVALTQQTAYARFATADDARRRFLVEVARSGSRLVTSPSTRPTPLVRALARAAAERRLLVWSRHARVQASLAETAVSGVVAETSRPYVGLSIVNEPGNKLDYYLGRELAWRRTGSGSMRDVEVTIALHNDAPAHGLRADVVARRGDLRGYRTKMGDHRVTASYLATAGALMKAVTVDGKPATAVVGAERGHPVFGVDVELPRGRTRTIVLRLQEPAGEGTPLVLRQPLVRPLVVVVQDAADA